MEEKPTAKRDALREWEVECQKMWEEAKVYEFDAAEGTEKFFVTFPYPYMNGTLHLGHAFTISKAEFMVRYQRLLGKQALFPFGLHCTGMPIKACADKIAKEINLYGNPPQFPDPTEPQEQEKELKAVQKELSAAHVDPLKYSSKKSKLLKKGHTRDAYQWEIMENMGLEETDLSRFSDSSYWLKYFPPLAVKHMKMFGGAIDWRRSFITTDINPFYDSFVRWQFWTLKDGGFLEYGKRYTIWSPADGQPCMDHDRKSGEGVNPQDYTLIKMKLQNPDSWPASLQSLRGRNLFLVCATLRPETMYGQTNCWALPTGEYGAFAINDHEVIICTDRSAYNLSFQGYSQTFGKVDKLATIPGQDLIGLAVEAPLSKYPVVHVLPMLTIKTTKGTGLVTSVPADSPDDFATLRDLKNKPALREKFGVQDEWVLPFEVVPIIRTPLGDVTAVTVVEEMKIQSQNDSVKLAEAKEKVYKLGFYEGEMIIGEYAGKPVQEVKNLVKDRLLEQKLAIPYSEPASQVISRSGDECVVCLTDQWYLKYGEPEWRKKVEEALARMNTFHSESRHLFETTLGWLRQWACSRTYGLGTRMPWDDQYLIESLSDSTIYFAYYTVAHLLHLDLEGHSLGPLQIQPHDMTREAWDFVFLGRPYKEECKVPEEKLAKMRAEFRYWYPLDLRVSGKDLIPNHLTFSLYNHAAVWGPEMCPLAFRGNGHLMYQKPGEVPKKMSKSEGNFITLQKAVEKWGADATRLALAEAGDALDDSTFAEATANASILRLIRQIEWIEKAVASNLFTQVPSPSPEDAPVIHFHERVFRARMASLIPKTREAYEKAEFHGALVSGWHAFQSARDEYLAAIGDDSLARGELLRQFCETQAILLSPICPHWAEKVWRLLGCEGFVVSARWPAEEAVDRAVLHQHSYLDSFVKVVRQKHALALRPVKGKPAPPITEAVIRYGTEFPDWHSATVELVRSMAEERGGLIPDKKQVMASLKGVAVVKKNMKLAAPLVASLLEKGQKDGIEALTVEMFDENEFLTMHLTSFQREFGVPFKVILEDGTTRKAAVPGEPTVEFLK